MDFLLFEPKTSTVWVPAGNTGSVDVIDTATQKVTRIEGFATKEMERNGKKHTVGPSAVSAGDGVVYIGNRGDSTICIVDTKKLAKVSCGPKLDSMPDGVVYVAPTKEVWVTTPRDKSIRILDEKTLKQKAKLTFDGEPEGYAVDATRGRFYTNLEDADKTLAIDLKTHKTVATWKPACGSDGPHGVRLDEPGGFLFIACSDKVKAMDVGHDGAVTSSLDTGDGVDDIDFAPSTRSIYVGAAKAATLFVAHADDKGMLSLTAKIPTVEGARNAAVDSAGNAYLSHAKASEIVVVSPAKK
jgi:DNA-binding beta-propeller fold protein YncE